MTQCTKGGYFGELALVTHKPRAASVYAVGDLVCAGRLRGVLGKFFLLTSDFRFLGNIKCSRCMTPAPKLAKGGAGVGVHNDKGKGMYICTSI